MIVEARSLCTPTIFGLAVGAQRDETDAMEERYGAEPLREFVPVHSREAQIEDRHIRLERFDAIKRFLPAIGDPRFVPSEAQKQGEGGNQFLPTATCSSTSTTSGMDKALCRSQPLGAS